jgi:hypothetical protein
MIYDKDHPYMKRLDEVLTHYFVSKTIDPAEHGKDYEEMKHTILDSLFLTYLGQDIRK